jgi:hypothetical protein
MADIPVVSIPTLDGKGLHHDVKVYLEQLGKVVQSIHPQVQANTALGATLAAKPVASPTDVKTAVAGVQQTPNKFSADQTFASGVFFTGLPTKDPHVVGQLWNNLGAPTISKG